MSKKTILIVPPRGVPVKSIRIRFSVAVIFLVLVFSGFIGYFIPFNKITLSDIEQNQKKNLTDQNNALLQKILSSLRLLNNLKEQVDRLEVKRENISTNSVAETSNHQQHPKKIDVDEMTVDALVHYVNSQEQKIANFLTVTNEDNNIFDMIPVISPVAEPYVISRVFGISADPFTGTEKWHYGIDFVAEMELFVYVTADGTVERVENHPVWGRKITIAHGNGLSTVYAHLGESKVNQGKRVSRGDIIGTIGTTGLSTGPHLHYEIRINGSPIDPYRYMFPTITAKIALNLQ